MEYNNYYNQQPTGQSDEMDWDDFVEAMEEPEFVVLPDGDYPFEVVTFSREHFSGSDKQPPCNRAVYTLRILAQDGRSTTVKHSLFVHKDRLSLITAFFVSIGLAKWGEGFRPQWKEAVGCKGFCKLGSRVYNGNRYNEIKRFYDPGKLPASLKPAAPQQPAYGDFNGVKF